MADVKGITKELLHEKSSYCDIWKGSAEQLITAGIVEQHMLPGEPSRNKTCVTFNSCRNQNWSKTPNYIQIKRLGKNRFCVRKSISEEEKKRRKKSEVHELLSAQSLREVEAMVAAIHQSPNEFRGHSIRYIKMETNIIREMFSGSHSLTTAGFSFDSQTLEKLNSHLNAINYLAANGRIVFRDQEKSRLIAEKYGDRGLEIPEKYSTTKRPRLQLVE